VDEKKPNSDCNESVQTEETVGDKDELEKTVYSTRKLYGSRHCQFLSVLVSGT
jgi:hypothetical protein